MGGFAFYRPGVFESKNTMNKSNPQADQLASNNPRPVVELVPNFAITNHGTVSLFHPLTYQAKDWLRLYCPADGEHQYFGEALVIEHRYVADIIHFATADGLVAAKSKSSCQVMPEKEKA